MRSVPVVVVAAVLLGIAAGCGDEAPSITSPSLPTPTSPVPSASRLAPSPSAGSLEPTFHDPSLIDVLPPVVDGRDGMQDFETGAEMADDPSLQESVEALALALFADEESYVVATVSRIRPGVFDDAFYRDWRDTFDAAVCEQAGGVDVGHGEVEIDGRLAFRSACVGGVLIYHLHLADPDTIISLQGAGPDDLGALVLDDLRLDMR